jgi:ubiquinone/menaquinone biosynthesis C-methylase UbiE
VLAIAALAGALFASQAACVDAQERSVRPGVNDPYEDPDLEEWIDRLEADDRAIFEYRHAIVAALGLGPSMEVADVGAGTGFLTLLIARALGPEGRVFAVDVVPEFLEHIAKSAEKEGLGNVVTVLGDQKTTRLDPDTVDVILISDTYHHFEFPQHTLASLRSALRDGGRMVVIDFERIVGLSDDFAIEHVRAGKGTVTDEIKDAGFDLVREIPLMEGEGQYYLEFRKRAGRRAKE